MRRTVEQVMCRIKIKKRIFWSYLLLFFVVFVTLEIGSLAILKFKEKMSSKRVLNLDAYERIDPNDPTNWVLVPNFEITFADLIEEKEKAGKWFSAKLLKEWIAIYGLSLSQIAIHINSFGFRGPEIREDKKRKIRMICIGDSVTFGPCCSFEYPRIVEKELIKKGYSIQVINAGVEGYSVKNVIKRIDYICEFNADIVTLFIGWNDTYSDRGGLSISLLDRACRCSSFLKLVREAIRKINIIVHKENVLPHSLPDTLEGKTYKKVNVKYDPPFLDEISILIDKLRIGNPELKIILFTLPSLFDPYKIPDKDTLKKGHLPTFTNNAYVLGHMVYTYNESIRYLSGEKNCYLIDLEIYLDSRLTPKKNYFFDSCHLTPDAQNLIGKYISNILIEEKIVQEEETDYSKKRL